MIEPSDVSCRHVRTLVLGGSGWGAIAEAVSPLKDATGVQGAEDVLYQDVLIVGDKLVLVLVLEVNYGCQKFEKLLLLIAPPIYVLRSRAPVSRWLFVVADEKKNEDWK